MTTNVWIEYVNHGWAITRIEPGQKRPTRRAWNTRERAIVKPEQAQYLECAGLCHAYSGTAAFDVDHYDSAKVWLTEQGIDIDDLFHAPDAVQIVSGEANRGKLLYALPEPLPSKSFADGAFELRSGTSAGKTVQDLLPPSKHPSGREYRWEGDWRKLPPFPPALLEIWKATLAPRKAPATETPIPPAELNELQALIEKRDPDCGYDEWIKTGMVIHHETEGSEDGLALWNEWSKNGEKYVGLQDLRSHWDSFGSSVHPATIAYLYSTDVASVDEFDILPEPEPAESTKDIELRYPRAILIRLSDVEPEEIDWLWDQRLARRKIAIISGDPGLGKSTAVLDMASRISTGGSWPDGRQATLGSVVVLSAEDGLRDVIAARVKRQGGDASRFIVLTAIDCGKNGERMFSLDGDIPILDEAIARLGDVSLVIIDPISAYLGSKDSYKDAEIRMLLSPLSALAEKHRVSILLIGHHTKNRNQRALYRSLGSIGFVAAARTAFVVARDPEDLVGRRCLLMPTKSNLGPFPSTFTFEIVDGGTLLWGEERTDVDPDSVLAASDRYGKKAAEPFAEEILRDLLRDGEVSAKEIKRRAHEAGISDHALRHAVKELGVIKRKEGQPGTTNQQWLWSLPESARQVDNLVSFGDGAPEKLESDESPSLETLIADLL